MNLIYFCKNKYHNSKFNSIPCHCISKSYQLNSIRLSYLAHPSSRRLKFPCNLLQVEWRLVANSYQRKMEGLETWTCVSRFPYNVEHFLLIWLNCHSVFTLNIVASFVCEFGSYDVKRVSKKNCSFHRKGMKLTYSHHIPKNLYFTSTLQWKRFFSTLFKKNGKVLIVNTWLHQQRLLYQTCWFLLQASYIHQMPRFLLEIRKALFFFFFNYLCKAFSCFLFTWYCKLC